MTNPHDIKNFYEEVDTLIAAVPQSEKLIVVGDFNARVDRDHQTWRLNVSKLKSSKVAGEFSSDLDGMLPDIPLDEQDSTEEQWVAFKDAVYSTALEHLGPATHKTRTSSTRTTKRYRHSCQRNTNCSEHPKTIPCQKQRWMPLPAQDKKCRKKFARCRTPDLAARMTKSRAKQTVTMSSVCTML
ncbi:hypothetical protein ACOMHN_026942 [Nucella lapillus]